MTHIKIHYTRFGEILEKIGEWYVDGAFLSMGLLIVLSLVAIPFGLNSVVTWFAKFTAVYFTSALILAGLSEM